jgi:ribonuclease HII
VIYDPAVVACPHRDLLSYINDSKKLSPKQRSKALAVIGKHAACVATAMVSHRTVDRLNINGATEYALRRLLAGLGVKPDVVLMDGTFKFRMDVPVIPIPAGDARSVSIASASIAAKLRRDAVMDKLDSLCPGYGLRNNKGYGTLYHRTRIFNLGPSALHRRTYEPVKGLLCGEGLFDDEDR